MGFLYGFNEETAYWEKYKEPFEAVRVSSDEIRKAKQDANDLCEYSTYLIRDSGNNLRCNKCGCDIPYEDAVGVIYPNSVNYCYNCGVKFLRSTEDDE